MRIGMMTPLSLALFLSLCLPAFSETLAPPTQTPDTAPVSTDTVAAPASSTTPKPKTGFKLSAESEALKMTDDIKTAKAQLKKHPDDAEAHFLMAAAYSRSPYLDKAFEEMKDVKKILRAKQDFEFIDRTLVQYEAMRENTPNDTVLLFRLAMAYYFKGYSMEKYPHHYKDAPVGDREAYYQKAQDTMSQVIALDPQDIWARDYLGYLVSENGKNLSKAISIWQESLAINSDQNPGAYLLLSQAYLQKGDLTNALIYGAKGLEIQQSMGMRLP
jgi:tetratricopeptide (TPR) repeat protein